MTLKRWFAGFFLLILMVVALFVNSILFSARSFQANLANVAPDTGGVIRLADLKAVDAQVAMIERETAPQRGEAAQLADRAAMAQKALGDAQDSLAALRLRVLSQTSVLEAKAGFTPAAATGEFNAADVIQRLDRVSAQRATAASTRDDVLAVRGELAKIDQQEAALEPLQSDAADLKAKTERAGEYVAKSEQTILGLKGQFGGNFIRIRNEADSLVKSSPFGIGAYLVEMHPTFLSTILVCIMGALGALLYLFPAYLNPNSRILFADIVVRLVFGMVVALAFYIVANASIASLAIMPGGESTTSAASLNPFSVSLIGIVAGIMADDIAAWIRERGREILGGGASSSSTTYVQPAPHVSAARDAQSTHRGSADPGDSPPRGGVVG